LTQYLMFCRPDDRLCGIFLVDVQACGQGAETWPSLGPWSGHTFHTVCWLNRPCPIVWPYGDIWPLIVLGVYCDRPKNSTRQKDICEVNGSIVLTHGVSKTHGGAKVLKQDAH